MGKILIKNLVTYAETDDNGDAVETAIVPKNPPKEALLEPHEGKVWHPILERWVSESDANRPMEVDESEIFPISSLEDEESD